MILDSKSDPYKHIIIININDDNWCNGIDEVQACGLNFKIGNPLMYMSLPIFSVSSYQNFEIKMIHQLSSNKHQKVSTTSLFNIHQGHYESLREYLESFNKKIIKVINLNQ